MKLHGVCLRSVADQQADDDSGFWIDPISLELPTDPVPVSISFNHDKPIGTAVVSRQGEQIVAMVELDEAVGLPETHRKLAIGCYSKRQYIEQPNTVVLDSKLTDIALVDENTDKGIPIYEIVV